PGRDGLHAATRPRRRRGPHRRVASTTHRPMSASLPFALAVAFAVSLVVTRVAEVVGRRRSLLDIPNERSSHAVPTPRIGGLGILAGTIAGWPLATGAPEPPLGVSMRGCLLAAGPPSPTIVWMLAAPLLLAVVGLIDDVRVTRVLFKYSGQ